MSNKKSIHVFADWESLDCPMEMGMLHVAGVKGREVFSFEYLDAWLRLLFRQK